MPSRLLTIYYIWVIIPFFLDGLEDKKSRAKRVEIGCDRLLFLYNAKSVLSDLPLYIRERYEQHVWQCGRRTWWLVVMYTGQRREERWCIRVRITLKSVPRRIIRFTWSLFYDVYITSRCGESWLPVRFLRLDFSSPQRLILFHRGYCGTMNSEISVVNFRRVKKFETCLDALARLS